MLDIMHSISDNKYTELVEWLCQKCDMFTFMIPNYGKRVEEANKAVEHFLKEYSEEEKKKFFEEEKQRYVEYCSKVDEIITPIKKHIHKRYYDTSYCGCDIYYEIEIVEVHLNNDTKNFLIKYSNLCMWTYPNMPEDVCFYSKGKCFMRTVAHEGILSINNSSETKMFLRKHAIPFRKNVDLDIHILPD